MNSDEIKTELTTSRDQSESVDRRGFLKKCFTLTGRAGIVSGALTGFLASRQGHTKPIGMRKDLGIIRPPFSKDEETFLSQCIRCTRCQDACVPGCIELFGPEAGPLQGTPYIVPTDAACTLCLDCGPACPTDAIPVRKDKSEARMGVAVVDKRLCVSHNGTGICGACFTACPLRGRAIIEDYRNAPEVISEFCTGCGLCEEFCIVDTSEGVRAIQVISERRPLMEAG